MGNSRITIKNVKFSETFSKETNCFSCNVYIDNKKFGHAENDGNGGCTFIHSCEGKKELFNIADEHCNSLADIDYGRFSLKSTMEHVVDDLFVKWLKERDTKKIMNKTKNALVWEIGGGYSYVTWGKGWTIAKLMTSPDGRAAIKKNVDKLNKEGKKIINTNIDFSLL